MTRLLNGLGSNWVILSNTLTLTWHEPDTLTQIDTPRKWGFILDKCGDIIFDQFIEFNSCNSTLKLVLCRKLKSFFDSYISHDFLDSFVSIQSVLSYKYIQNFWILFLHFPWLDLYWTNVETNNICLIHWIQLLQFYIEVSLM